MTYVLSICSFRSTAVILRFFYTKITVSFFPTSRNPFTIVKLTGSTLFAFTTITPALSVVIMGMWCGSTVILPSVPGTETDSASPLQSILSILLMVSFMCFYFSFSDHILEKAYSLIINWDEVRGIKEVMSEWTYELYVRQTYDADNEVIRQI